MIERVRGETLPRETPEGTEERGGGVPSPQEQACLQQHLRLGDETQTPAPEQVLLAPPAGRVVHGMGQWEEYNRRLLEALPSTARPAAQLVFVDIGDTPRGWRPQGVAVRLRTLEQDGFVPVLDIGLRGNQPTQVELDRRADKLFGIDHEVAEGTRFDARIEDLARVIRDFGKPVMVRIGGEFNGWWNGYHPYAYPKAFRKIVKRFQAEGDSQRDGC